MNYNFIESCSMAYILPMNHWPTCNHLHLKNIEKKLSDPMKPINKFCYQWISLSNTKMDPVNGSLQCCCDYHLNHFPYLEEKKRIQLISSCTCGFLRKQQNQKLDDNSKPKGTHSQVVLCAICKIHLCHWFEIFHHIDYLDLDFIDTLHILILFVCLNLL